MEKLESAVYVSWEESERGWGVRPDGGSLHLTAGDYQMFLSRYWGRMPDKVGGLAPDEYSRPASEPMNVTISEKLYQRLKDSETECGIWIGQFEQRELEKSDDLRFYGRRTGWVPVN
ncbi:MAG: hypothetical protein WCI72_01335 [archaeon]